MSATFCDLAPHSLKLQQEISLVSLEARSEFGIPLCSLSCLIRRACFAFLHAVISISFGRITTVWFSPLYCPCSDTVTLYIPVSSARGKSPLPL